MIAIRQLRELLYCKLHLKAYRLIQVEDWIAKREDYFNMAELLVVAGILGLFFQKWVVLGLGIVLAGILGLRDAASLFRLLLRMLKPFEDNSPLRKVFPLIQQVAMDTQFSTRFATATDIPLIAKFAEENLDYKSSVRQTHSLNDRKQRYDSWFIKNNRVFYLYEKDGQIAAYSSILPLTGAAAGAYLQGQLSDWELSGENLLPNKRNCRIIYFHLLVKGPRAETVRVFAMALRHLSFFVSSNRGQLILAETLNPVDKENPARNETATILTSTGFTKAGVSKDGTDIYELDMFRPRAILPEQAHDAVAFIRTAAKTIRDYV